MSFCSSWARFNETSVDVVVDAGFSSSAVNCLFVAMDTSPSSAKKLRPMSSSPTYHK